MSQLVTARKFVSLQTICLLLVVSLIVVGLLRIGAASGDQLPSRSITLTKAQPSASDTYSIAFTVPNPETLGSIEVQFCSDSPLIGTPCAAPVGMNVAAATLSQEAGEIGFTVSSGTANSLILSRAASHANSGPVSFVLSNVTDPSTTGSYYARLQTFASTNATGTANDYGGLAFAINNPLKVTTTVPPYLYFCVGITVTGTDCTTATGDYINLGTFFTDVSSEAQTQMVAGTNADTGYTITVNGDTLTSGNNIIPAIATPDLSRPGTSQFGMNLVANQDPEVGANPLGQGVGRAATGYNTPNSFKFGDGDVVASTPQADYPMNYTVSYITNISSGQAPGVYVTTLTYVATGAF
jgi:hypothetical protein